ncbi:VirB3 family type IV secretion system protein [Thioalkalivibrio sp. ALE16]|uniref:VirB3 family type IV secretion system protein n=1 Tax=Thioalkalivibrio sp. ALE16 TaxID=1158172 RepID=UPI000368F1AE|nr:VirB3 family type IV secretion system protein [Thioalkalivibrio sp. ALE16]
MEDENHEFFTPEGLRKTPVRPSLIEGKRIAGVEANMVIANLTITAAAVMGLYWYWWLALAWLIHKFLRHIYSKDKDVRKVYLAYARQSDRYEPWPRINQKQAKRPKGWGRGMLC